MPTVFIPPSLRKLTQDQEQVIVAAKTVREAIEKLEQQFPGIQQRLCAGENLKPGLSVAVDGNVASLGLLQKLRPDSELHFLPAIGGG